MRLVDNIVQDIESAFEPLHSGNLDEQDFEIEIPSSKDNDNLWVSLNSELRSRGIDYDLLDTYEVGRNTVYYVMLKRLWKPEYYNEGVEGKMKLAVNEELPKNDQGAAIIGDDIREIIENISNEMNALNEYVDQMKNWTSNTYISDREYKAMQYNISRIIGGGYRIVENGRSLREYFDV